MIQLGFSFDGTTPGVTRAHMADVAWHYSVLRLWGSGRRLLFVTLRPSERSSSVDDALVNSCTYLARREGYTGVEMVSLFARREPSEEHPQPFSDDPVGPQNDAVIADAAGRAGTIVAAWGSPCRGVTRAALRWREGQVMRLLRARRHVLCLGTTGTGFPKHPRTITSHTVLQRYAPERNVAPRKPKDVQPSAQYELRRNND